MTPRLSPHSDRSALDATPDDMTAPPGGWIELSDEALLTRMLLRGLRPETAACASAALMARFGGLGPALAADAGEIERATGLDPGLVGELHLLREISVRISRARASGRSLLASSSAVHAYVRAALAHRPREQFRTLYLDRRNALLQDEWVADGSVDHAPVYPREVIRRALELSASALILVHNHPSGDPEPSQADVVMTRKIVDAAKVFDIRVHDHLIVGREDTASLRALGHLS
ncbi:RadC family protein [Brevundimonas bacteroides]|uniref:RadC family protein n=1 Tax=Brevundimonas bacteroides TaxID=74311 RepID=UPI001FDF213B|nr:DNA repair protein RadC [Brevundimonas bacteroides]